MSAGIARARSSWSSMIQRCTNPKNPSYKNYGGRGIFVCERWLSFDNFLADMGERPAGMTIDRRDGKLGYEPSNCRWATPQQQADNPTNEKWGRKLRADEIASDLVAFRVTEDEYRELKRQAGEQSLSEWIRERCTGIVYLQASDTSHACKHPRLTTAGTEDNNAIRCIECGKRWTPVEGTL